MLWRSAYEVSHSVPGAFIDQQQRRAGRPAQPHRIVAVAASEVELNVGPKRQTGEKTIDHSGSCDGRRGSRAADHRPEHRRDGLARHKRLKATLRERIEIAKSVNPSAPDDLLNGWINRCLLGGSILDQVARHPA